MPSKRTNIQKRLDCFAVTSYTNKRFYLNVHHDDDWLTRSPIRCVYLNVCVYTLWSHAPFPYVLTLSLVIMLPYDTVAPGWVSSTRCQWQLGILSTRKFCFPPFSSPLLSDRHSVPSPNVQSAPFYCSIPANAHAPLMHARTCIQTHTHGVKSWAALCSPLHMHCSLT